MTYNVFSGTLNPAQQLPKFSNSLTGRLPGLYKIVPIFQGCLVDDMVQYEVIPEKKAR